MSSKKITAEAMETYARQTPGKSPKTQKTHEQTVLNQTMTSDWKSKMSPRGRGRIQIAMPSNSDNATDYAGEAVS